MQMMDSIYRIGEIARRAELIHSAELAGALLRTVPRSKQYWNKLPYQSESGLACLPNASRIKFGNHEASVLMKAIL